MKGREPVRLPPIRKEYLWGTEDWMLSDLHEQLKQPIPLLIKIITAREALSIQVHPPDDFAEKEEKKSGKTEMWYILECDPGACLYYGLKHKISPEEFLKRIRNKTIPEVCHKVPVKTGDVFYIPAGLLHAVGKGITLAEIQQNSDITYRVFDYDREDGRGEKRPLHIEKAAVVAGFLPPLQGHRPMGMPVEGEGHIRTLLVQCPYFKVCLYEIKKELKGICEDDFQSILILDGEGTLVWEGGMLPIQKRDSLFLPQGMGWYEIRGGVRLLLSERGY
ncbi:MAG: class I mannose-6-phosphate isomerase [Lachnospiraceae bacterium]|nr:class I mannose-6-phosphate isomerase [Lachnospiraceae bacterium]